MTTIARDADAVQSPAEVAMMAFVEKVVRHADQVTERDIAGLRTLGYSDEQLFDVASAAAAEAQ